MARIFVTGIGTGVGKTLVSACVTEALNADYWKPVQSGLEEGTDTDSVRSLLSNAASVCHPEAYRLREPASPHLSARLEGTRIDEKHIVSAADGIRPSSGRLVIEGAGGLLVPLNESVFTLDLILALKAHVIVVAQNYLGSINHSLLTSRILKQSGIPVLGWIFSGPSHSNRDEIVGWSEYPLLGHVPQTEKVDKTFVREQAHELKAKLESSLRA